MGTVLFALVIIVVIAVVIFPGRWPRPFPPFRVPPSEPHRFRIGMVECEWGPT
jgi:hypothetical protein